LLLMPISCIGEQDEERNFRRSFGWASVGSVGASYGRGYKTEVLRRWLEKIAVET